MDKTLFSKIIDKDIEATIVYEDELCVAFQDIHPQAPVHVLLVPRDPVDKLMNVRDDQAQLMGHLLVTAPKIAQQLGVGDNFRLVINNGEQAGQTVFHLHLHILGGRVMHWPPG